VTLREFFEWLSAQTGLPLPAMVTGATGGSRRAPTNKRVSNRKLRQELGWSLRYPTFREGCAAELARPGALGRRV
jgi:nucleoside-diphosphate-sugar epimerase